MSSYEFVEHEEYEEHVVPKTVYLTIFGALMVLTLITVAVIKATLVVLFFMHVKYASRTTKLVVVASIVWLGFLFFITLSDYVTRGWLMAPPIEP